MSRMDDIKKDVKKKAQESREQFRRDWQDFIDHPLLYMALIISACLSSLAGLSIGLGVKVDNYGNVTYHFDLSHVFFALIYAALFPLFFEYGLSNWMHKFLKRESENPTQKNVSIAMILLTGFGTAVTAYSAMDVLVTTLGFFSSFQEIPANVQKWIAFSLPTMFILNIAAGELYRQNSHFAELIRSAEMELREKKIDADTEIRLAQMEAEKQIALHAATEYSRKAIQETDKIGAQKGSGLWDKDRERHGGYTPALVANAAETEKVELANPQTPPRRNG